MEVNVLKTILNKFINRRLLSDEEIHQLKSGILNPENINLVRSLEDIWIEYEKSYPLDIETSGYLKQNIDELIKQPKEVITKKVNLFKIWKNIAAILMPFVLILSLYTMLNTSGRDKEIYSEFTKIDVAKGDRATVTLPDGTKVSLNSNSSLTYSPLFGVENRFVTLVGEGYFEVVKKTDHPFVVNSGAINIKVLGTIFNIRNIGNNSIVETSLVEGKIEIINNKNNEILVLQPNQKAIYDEVSNSFVVNETDLWVETAWKRHELVFQSENLSVVFEQLEQFYGETILVEGDYPRANFTGSFKEENIYEVLKNLQQHYDFAYTKNIQGIRIIFNK